MTDLEQSRSYGAVARAEALIAGDPKWYEVTRWPRDGEEEEDVD